MKKSAPVRLMTTVLSVSILFAACKKESSSSISPAQEAEAATFSAQSEAEVETVINDVFDNVMGVNAEVGIGGTGIFGRLSPAENGRDMDVDSIPSCTKVSITFLAAPSHFPVRIAIDFGAGCMGRDGHFRAGKIVTEYTGRLMEPGTSATTAFQGFKLDSISVEGTLKITNTTAAGSNRRQFTLDIQDVKVSKLNGDFSVWSSQRVVTQIEGNYTPIIPADDVFRISGSGHGRVKHGDFIYEWQSEGIEPLIKKFTCHWISKGTVQMRKDSQATNSQWTALLDYGQGECDHVATITINGVSYQIQLPH